MCVLSNDMGVSSNDMSVTFNEDTKVFHLHNHQVSLVLGVLRTGHLAHWHLGAPITGPLDSSNFRMDQNRGFTVYLEPERFDISLGLEQLAYPAQGRGDFRIPAIDCRDASGSPILDPIYEGHRIIGGKPSLSGLPHTKATTLETDTQAATTLEIDLVDAYKKLRITLSYTIFKNLPAIATSVGVTNLGNESVSLERVLSCNLDLPDANWEMGHLSGDWIKERHLSKTALRPGVQAIGSTRGASSAQHNPFVFLSRPTTTETQGEALSMGLVYSGNFTIALEVDARQQTRWQGGIQPEGFLWILQPNETFQTPEAILCYSQSGLGALSRTMHTLIQEHLIPEIWRNKPRPVLINNWEATYFDFNQEKLLAIAREASDLGIELFVLDDGWFSTRSSDQAGLGDWWVNREKLPGGLKGLSEAIHQKGMQFGIWIEPEMVNTGTVLFETHPDWVIGESPRPRCQARHQYVLDYANPQVVNHIFEQLCQVLDDVVIDYIKWDMNRNISDAFSAYLPARQQGELHHRYILGLYQLYQRLSDRYPHVLIESCSAGGGRFDLGLLYYAPQAWASDNSDAVSRLKIQYGTSMAYPVSSMGAHVSAVPNHQVLRETPLKMRGDVAFFGVLGYELDLCKLTPAEKEVVAAQIRFYKQYRQLLHSGDFYRLLSPFEGGGNQTAWMVVSKDQTMAVLAWYQVLAEPNPGPQFLKLSGLAPDGNYRVISEPVSSNGPSDKGLSNSLNLSGGTLMGMGLLMAPSFNGIEVHHVATGDFQSRLWLLLREN